MKKKSEIGSENSICVKICIEKSMLVPYEMENILQVFLGVFLLGEFFPQTIQLMTIQVRIKKSKIFLTVNPHRLRQPTIIRPQPFSVDVVLSEKLFITSNHPLPNLVVFLRFATGDSVNGIVLS